MRGSVWFDMMSFFFYSMISKHCSSAEQFSSHVLGQPINTSPCYGVWPVAAQEDATSQEEPVKRKKLQAADGEPLGGMGWNMFEYV